LALFTPFWPYLLFGARWKCPLIFGSLIDELKNLIFFGHLFDFEKNIFFVFLDLNPPEDKINIFF